MLKITTEVRGRIGRAYYRTYAAAVAAYEVEGRAARRAPSGADGKRSPRIPGIVPWMAAPKGQPNGWVVLADHQGQVVRSQCCGQEWPAPVDGLR